MQIMAVTPVGGKKQRERKRGLLHSQHFIPAPDLSGCGALEAASKLE